MAAYNMRGLSFYRVSGLTDTVLAVERGCAWPAAMRRTPAVR